MRADAEATAEVIAAQIAAAQTRVDQAEAARAATETDRDTAIAQAAYSLPAPPVSVIPWPAH